MNNTVMVHIRNLRDKIEEDNRKPRYIKTVWGVGYKFGEIIEYFILNITRNIFSSYIFCPNL